MQSSLTLNEGEWSIISPEKMCEIYKSKDHYISKALFFSETTLNILVTLQFQRTGTHQYPE